VAFVNVSGREGKTPTEAGLTSPTPSTFQKKRGDQLAPQALMRRELGDASCQCTTILLRIQLSNTFFESLMCNLHPTQTCF
jgi:hypothetical protein